VTRNRLILVVLLVLALHGAAASQPFAPIVDMRVISADGQAHDLTVPESGVATVTLKDGTEYGFRPTIHDSSPWNRIVVTIFKSGTAETPTAILGQVELKRGGPAVDSGTQPTFKVAIPKVSPSRTQAGSSTTSS
jgi:hypothetical protein